MWLTSQQGITWPSGDFGKLPFVIKRKIRRFRRKSRILSFFPFPEDRVIGEKPQINWQSEVCKSSHGQIIKPLIDPAYPPGDYYNSVTRRQFTTIALTNNTNLCLFESNQAGLTWSLFTRHPSSTNQRTSDNSEQRRNKSTSSNRPLRSCGDVQAQNQRTTDEGVVRSWDETKEPD